MTQNRTTPVEISEAELAAINTIVHAYQRDGQVPRLDRATNSVPAKRFINRALGAFPPTAQATTP